MSALIATESRPRTLAWFHAGPLLFGDWGTSRLYVLGFAFYFTGHASPLYIGAVSLLMIAVAAAYTIICRCFPEGGGAYAASRAISPTLSVVAATLLLCDYTVTASLSAIEGFHYIGAPGGWAVWLSVGLIASLGVVNWYGARSAGRLALGIALAALAASVLIAVLSLPLLPKGLAAITAGDPSIHGPWNRWEGFVRVVLALSGLEAVANMTGLMVKPVARTARRTIWPVLVEVVCFNMLFAVALGAVPQLAGVTAPDHVVHEVRAGLTPDQVPPEVKEYRDTPMRLLAEHASGNALGPAVGRVVTVGVSVAFALLLFSAVNTAIMAVVAVIYALASDREAPRSLARLNGSGVPRWGLLLACLMPVLVLVLERDAKALGELYAIGVVGAIAINVLCCAVNRALPIALAQRAFLYALSAVMIAIECTIVYAKPNAAIFAGGMIVLVMAARYAGRLLSPGIAQAAPRRLPAPLEPDQGWMSELTREGLPIDAARPRLMLAARGRDQAEFAVDLAKRRGATLFVLFVRTLRLLDVQPGQVPRIEDDPDAQAALGTASVLGRRAGVPVVPIYVAGPDIAGEILDYTTTYGCELLIMGKTRRGVFARSLDGDVVAQVARHLPEGVTLLTRAPGAVPERPEPDHPAQV
ncbi:MAG: hypothetical protein C0468_01990 [Planctomyces sp.]|nr:hypothetical protein [Planctomyces sp.]